MVSDWGHVQGEERCVMGRDGEESRKGKGTVGEAIREEHQRCSWIEEGVMDSLEESGEEQQASVTEVQKEKKSLIRRKRGGKGRIGTKDWEKEGNLIKDEVQRRGRTQGN